MNDLHFINAAHVITHFPAAHRAVSHFAEMHLHGNGARATVESGDIMSPPFKGESTKVKVHKYVDDTTVSETTVRGSVSVMQRTVDEVIQ